MSCPSRRRAPKRAAARRPVPCVVATKATKKTNDDDVRVNNDDGVENAPIPARSFPRRRALASFAALAAAASTSASASAADLESLESIAQDVNKQIMRQVDPRRAYYDQAEVELEMELGAPPQGEPSLRPGVTPGDPENGERDVVTTASGLQYAGVVVGRGEPIRTADLVVAHVVRRRRVPGSARETPSFVSSDDHAHRLYSALLHFADFTYESCRTHAHARAAHSCVLC